MDKQLIQFFIREDAPEGDITTKAVFGKNNQKVRAKFLAKEDLVISGFDTVKAVLHQGFKSLSLKCFFKDGTAVKKGTVIAEISGLVAELLVAERLLLNLLQHLSGVATTTLGYVSEAKKYKVAILDTRKTTAGLRLEEKLAVLHGGGKNHRIGLSDQYLIKDNHIDAAGSITNAIQKVREHQKKSRVKKLIEVEVRDLKEFQEALLLKPDIILLDNMRPQQIKKMVALRNKHSQGKKFPELEISGGVNLKNLKQYTKLGVERISVGALTHSVKAVDISLKIV